MNNLFDCDDLIEYLDLLSKLEDRVIILCIKDTAGYWLDEKIQAKLFSMGLKETLIKKLFVGYVALINNGKPAYEKLDTDTEVVEFHEKIENVQYDIISKSFRKGNVSSIRINGKEYSVNDRGLNIVVYGSKMDKVEDAVCFDTHEKDLFCIRILPHYDIGVIGLWWGSNYGSCLNGYAVYKALTAIGKSVWMIYHHYIYESRSLPQNRFLKNIYPCYALSPIMPLEKYDYINSMCDIFMAGSDQIWKCIFTETYQYEFMLRYIDDSKKKISFASSFGHGWDDTPKEMLPEAIKYMHRFDAVSVREQSGAEICKEVYGIKAEVVSEPVFCLTQEDYAELIEKSNIDVNEPYILCYILDPTPEIKEAILGYEKLTGLKIVNVLDLDPQLFEEHKKILDLPNTMDQISPQDLMKLFSKAEFVITDSFHGTCFSIIFNRKFISIENTNRGAVRFPELLEKYNLSDRLVTDPNQTIPVSESYLQEIDYEPINKIICKEREHSLEWLRFAVETPKDKMPSIILPNRKKKPITSILDIEHCTGCGACVSVCPKDALSLKQDRWGYYRSSLDPEKCVGCGLCTKICPALELPEKTNKVQPPIYAFIAADKKTLENSSSGGVFPMLANEAFKRGGCVAGAAWTDDLHVEHILVEDKNDLFKVQKSKYLQSYLGDFDRKIKEKLDAGQFVLFSGCPCQVTGLKAYLGKDYDNLITVDLLCGNSPSSEFFQKYLKDSFHNGVKDYQFRYKKQGWNADCITLTLNDGTKIERRGGGQDDYQKLYHPHVMCPPHCEQCKYQAIPRFGDITIGDFWEYSKHDSSVDNRGGISAVLCNNEKGQAFFDSIPDEEIKVKKNVPLEWLGGNGYAVVGHNYSSPYRDRFYKAIQTMSFSQAVKTALTPNLLSNYPDPLSLPPLHYDTSQLRFRFDANMWEEHFINGRTVLTTKTEKPPLGYYVTMPMMYSLVKGKRYTLSIRFMVKTDSKELSFNVKESDSQNVQIIYTHNVKPENADTWVTLNADFVADSNLYDEFMIGAAHISGESRFLKVDFIHISDAENVNQDLKNQLTWMTNAADFLETLSKDFVTDKKFVTFMDSMRGRKIALLKAYDKAGRFMQKAADYYNAEVVFSSPKTHLGELTEQEWQLCKTADKIVCCCVHGTETHERDGTKCIDIWDILRDESLTSGLSTLHKS